LPIGIQSNGQTCVEEMMESSKENQVVNTPFVDIVAYATGDGAFSLTMNGIAAFSMLFYTQALGLDYKLAALVLSISVFWDAITDPVMGYITDHTHSRFGRRHVYILFGGVWLALSFYFLWSIPASMARGMALFWYLLVMNIMIRTAVTIFYIPYLALGFEICHDYYERSKLQGARSVSNMTANMLGPALAWYLFFKDTGTVQSTDVVANYEHMGTAFSIATLIIVLMVTFATRKYLVDSRQKLVADANAFTFFKDTKEILQDKFSLIIYSFYAIISQGMVLVASLQMYLYIYYMNFGSGQKAIAHGTAMLGFAIGSLLSPIIAKKIDKKPTAVVGAMVSITGNICLALFFLTGLLNPSSTLTVGGTVLPIAMIVFVPFHAMYWLGNGIVAPITFSMVADTAEINKYKTGVLKDGSYSAMFSFLGKLAQSVGLFISGHVLGWIGFISGGQTQTAQAVHNLVIATLSSGIVFASLAVLALWSYPVNKEFMEKLKMESGQ
jgi:glycoside/pentoside/hexuronide:cation symporter, GPH family